ncbi:hypothetical protein M5D96_002816 [Drosophila gunungcola]|uniref:Uncharacterized protein n=1 Tax=Drosophila gunungcola TaxID=103775 RepID=A0A9P9Z118_9MUSC|nr:hypothetical protein M5D96_002816 [Drosophila gunungcola]
MPKKVITRRQRKAAESKQKAEQESNQNQPGLKPSIGEDRVDEEIRAKIDKLIPIPTAAAAPSSNEALETEEVKEMTKKNSGRNVLPKRNSATQQEKATGVPQRNLPLERSNKDLKGDVLKNLEAGPSGTSNEPSGLAPDQGLEPPKVFGNKGYFVLTGTNDQLAHQVADLAKKNIVIQSHVCLPSDIIEKAQKQLAELERNREQILEKMRNKHATLAQPPTSRQKEKESNME